MKPKVILVLLLLVVAGAMIYMGIKANMNPPILTGAGFVLIALLFLIKEKN